MAWGGDRQVCLPAAAAANNPHQLPRLALFNLLAPCPGHNAGHLRFLPQQAHLQQKPWPRKAFQYAAYAFWPMLVLWVLYSYPGGRQSAAGQLQTGTLPLRV